MITTERLKELIEQGAKIWVANSISVYDLDLIENENAIISIGKSTGGKCLCITSREKDDCGLVSHWERSCFRLEQLFEIKDHAEWYCKTTAERTERFEPPMWEDIEKDGYLFTFIKPKDIHTIAFAVNWGMLWANEIVILYDDDYCVDECRTIYNEPATKENYIKACEIVRDLFNKGGAK